MMISDTNVLALAAIPGWPERIASQFVGTDQDRLNERARAMRLVRNCVYSGIVMTVIAVMKTARSESGSRGVYAFCAASLLVFTNVGVVVLSKASSLFKSIVIQQGQNAESHSGAFA